VQAPDVAGLRAEDIARTKDAYAKGGWTAYLQTSLNQLLENSRQGYVPPFVIASFYARLGQKEEAFAYLEKSFQQHGFRITRLKVSFEFDSLHSDPRYADLVKRVGLPK